MKRWIHAASQERRRAKRPEKQYVYDVLDMLGWPDPVFCDRTKRGYRLKWGQNTSLIEKMAADLGAERAGLEFPDLPHNEDGTIDFYNADEFLAPDGSVDFKKVNEIYYPVYMKHFNSACSEVRKHMEEQLDDVYNKTGIRCELTIQGWLLVPFAETTN